MAKEKNFFGIAVVKKGKEQFVDLRLLASTQTREAAGRMLRLYGDIKPLMVLTEQEVREMHVKLTSLLEMPKSRSKRTTAKQMKSKRGFLRGIDTTVVRG